jgi:anti-sigma regulatory factor (Ser/Thr protein kinase)
MNDQIELSLANQGSEVQRLQDQLEAFARQHGFAARVLHDLQLALEEHLTNILSHSYNDKLEHQIRVSVELKARELRVEIEDDGRPFNPLEHPAPDLSKPIEERPVGGLGIHMIRKSLDGMEYRRAEGKNILVMIKRT